MKNILSHNILIIGDGFLGNGIKSYLNTDFNIVVINKKKIKLFLSKSKIFLQYIEKHKIKIIFNCIGNSKKNLDFNEYIEPNIKVPLKILSILANKKITFINFSSQDEDKVDKYFEKKIFPRGNIYNYAISKSIFTKILKKNFYNNFIINFKIPVIYGPNSPKHMLYGESIEKDYQNKFFLIKNPNYLNNFIHINELARVIEILLDKKIFKNKYYYEIISNNKPQTVYDFISTNLPNIKIKLSQKIKKNAILNSTLITKNKSIIKFFK